jgi:hypothetical protein
MLCKRRRDERFAFLDIGFSEEELPVQVGQVDRVEVDNLDVSKADEDEVFEQFAADTAGADDEEFALSDAAVSFRSEEGACVVRAGGGGHDDDWTKLTGIRRMKLIKIMKHVSLSSTARARVPAAVLDANT